MTDPDTDVESSELSAEEVAQIQATTEDDRHIVDVLILGLCTERWSKVALVAGSLLKTFARELPHLPLAFVQVRMEAIEDLGLIEIAGDVWAMRQSEVRLRKSATYLHLRPGQVLPLPSEHRTHRMVVLIEADVSPEWQQLVSDWIARSSCLYVMAWGRACSSWDDSVDMANIEAFDFADVPDDKFIITTWHTDDTVQEVFWFAKRNALHPTVELESTVLLHIAADERKGELLRAYALA